MNRPMDEPAAEPAAFETRALIAPQRDRRSRLALIVPVVALIGIAVAGVSGGRRDPVAVIPDQSVDAPQTSVELISDAPVLRQPQYPSEVVGLDVQRLGDVQLAKLDRDDLIAIAGWYDPTAIVDCPRLTPSYGDPSTTIRPGYDPWAYCERSGVLYDARTGLEQRNGIGPASVNASLTLGVRLPVALEHVDAEPMPVVFLGHFVESSTACMLLGACPSELIVDYLAWAPGS